MDYPELKRILDEEAIEFVDLRVVDLLGRLRHVTLPASRFTEDLLKRGVGFDGSNYRYRKVAGSDLIVHPDLSTAYVEERDGERILSVIGDIHDAVTGKPSPNDPRGIAKRVERLMVESGIADEVRVGPELEFYVFDDAAYGCEPTRTFAEVFPAEGLQHDERPAATPLSAYHWPLPEDRLFGLRCEMARQLDAAGIPVKYHHHEVGPFGQHEIELSFGGLLRMADATLLSKAIVRNVAAEAGFSATFLPKPLFGQAGSGLHLHQYLVKGGKNLFGAGDGLSELALAYVGGLLTHGASLMGLTNPTTNSYRRLVPGYEAPVHLVYGAGNRSAAVRVPTYAKGNEVRIELRTMDATCNPYLAFAAILLAGLDGVKRGLDAKKLGLGPFDCDLHEPGQMDRDAPHTLEDALRALADDHAYLTAGGVFSEEDIAHWIAVKEEEAADVASRPHPREFELAYDL